MFCKYRIFSVLLFFVLVNTAFSQQSDVTVSFTVLDERDNFWADLKLSDIQLLDEKKTLPISSIKLKTVSSLEVVIMVDASASQERMLPVEKQVAEYFIENILKKEQDKIGIVKFSGGPLLEQDLTNDFASAKKRLGAIEFEPPEDYIVGNITKTKTPPSGNANLSISGSTSIWESVRQVAESLASVKPSDSRRAIVLISDGVNTSGETKFNELIEFSLKKQIPIFTIGIGDEFYGGIDKEALNKLSDQTGGIAILPKEKLSGLPQIMKRLEQSLRAFYQITFTPLEKKSKKPLREIKIVMVNPQLRKREIQILPSKISYLH